MSSTPRPARLPFFVGTVLVLAVCAAYAGVFNCGFVNYDDNTHVWENPLVRGGLSWTGVKAAFTEGHASLWMPLTWLSYMAEVSCFGLNVVEMHVVNVLLHAANAVLLFTLLRRATGRLWESAAVATLFALHPLNVESVAWIAERKSVLSTLLALLSLHAYVRYAQKPSVAPYLAALGWFALGLMAKAMLVTLPAALLLLDAWPLARFSRVNWRRLVIEKIPFFLLTIGCCLLTFRASHVEGHVVTLAGLPLEVRFSNAAVAYVAYLEQMVWPAGLAVIYPHPKKVEALAALLSLAVLGGITFAAWRVRRERPFVLVGWLWYLGILVPVLGFVQVGAQARADRFTYLPQIGIFIAVVWTMAGWCAAWPWRARAYGFSAVAVALALMTAWQVGFWTNGATLFERNIAVTHDNVWAYCNAGFARARLGDYPRAIEHYRAAIRLWPENAETWNNLGSALAHLGRDAEAVTTFQQALALDPGFAPAQHNLAAAHARLSPQQ
jgi:tetratricopeptide (TPR) repeat protein